ncbi:predicted protein [Botrytis cinerea T4]|uniref:Uncharacterized protein n=1 Tax=Botryotinia fuckeliana (strain T4) TaxID=999810 RepID=G2YHS5_BOTF4|nr:predicted protein [Botrytis cinerea T4]
MPAKISESIDETFGFAVSKASNLLSRHAGSGGERYRVRVEQLLYNLSNLSTPCPQIVSW